MKGSEQLEREEMVEQIRMDVHKKFNHVDWPEPIMEPVYRGRLKKTLIENRKSITDSNTGITWDIVSDMYDLYYHEQVVHDLISAIPQEFGTPDIAIDLWSDSARLRVNAVFPEVPDKMGEIKVGDIIRPRVLAYSSYDRSTYHGTVFGGDQLVCGNGMIAFRGKTKKRKHIVSSRIAVEELAAAVTDYLENFSDQIDLWRTWAQKQLEKTEFEDILEALPFSEAETEKILELPLLNNDGRFLKELEKVTLWDVNSAATQYARHEVRGVQRSFDLESEIAAVMYNA